MSADKLETLPHAIQIDVYPPIFDRRNYAISVTKNQINSSVFWCKPAQVDEKVQRLKAGYESDGYKVSVFHNN
jgi:hypothetical protein